MFLSSFLHKAIAPCPGAGRIILDGTLIKLILSYFNFNLFIPARASSVPSNFPSLIFLILLSIFPLRLLIFTAGIKFLYIILFF